MGQVSDTEVGVKSDPGCNFLAKGQAPLVADNTVAGTFIGLPVGRIKLNLGAKAGFAGPSSSA
jgi:hypothetical protein